MRAPAIAMLLCAASAGAQVPTEGWTEFDPYSRWHVSCPTETSILMLEDGASQTVGPGWVVSDFRLCATASIRLSLRVDSPGDDDFFGFAFCRADDTHMYLVDWKGGPQHFDWGDTTQIEDDYAEMGLKLKKIDGAFTRDGLWGGEDGTGVSTLAGPVGLYWLPFTTYVFEVDLAPGRIVVRRDGEAIFDVPDASFGGGAIATYGFSQDQLRFFDIIVSGSACAADFDGNCALNLFDFLAFQTAFGNEDPAADLAPPFGVLNVFDFLAFQTAFGTGC